MSYTNFDQEAKADFSSPGQTYGGSNESPSDSNGGEQSQQHHHRGPDGEPPLKRPHGEGPQRDFRQYIEELTSERDNLTNIINDHKISLNFNHVFKLLEQEIAKHSADGLSTEQEESNPNNLIVPYTDQKILKKSRKIYMPTDKYPTFNFVGRIVGPRGRTIKEIEQKTGVKILIRGRGSMKDSNLEEMRRGKANYEHLLEKLHVILTVDGSEAYCQMKLDYAEKELKILTNPEVVENAGGRDEIKKKQLNELAILNQASDSVTLKPTSLSDLGPTTSGLLAGATAGGAVGHAHIIGAHNVPQIISHQNGAQQIVPASGIAYQHAHAAAVGQPYGHAHGGNLLNLRSPIEGTPIFYGVQHAAQPVVSSGHLVQIPNGAQVFHQGQQIPTHMLARRPNGYTAGGKMDSSLVVANKAGHGSSPY